MRDNEHRNPPRVMQLAIAVGAGWASGVYAGKLSIDNTIMTDWIATAGFGLLAVLMSWMVLARQV